MPFFEWAFFAEMVGWAAVAVGLVSAWPQVLRMRRTGTTDGVSWASAVLGVATVLVWLGYGLAAGDPVQVVNNALALAAALSLCGLLVRYARPRLWPALAGLAGAVTLVLAVWSGLGTAGVAVAASTLSIVRMVPQARLVLASRSLFGLCPWSTLLGVFGSLLWLGYGLVVEDVAVTVTSLLASALTAVVAFRRLPPRRTLRSLANGRLGPAVSRVAAPLAGLFA